MPFQGIDAGPIPAECKKSLLLLFKKLHKFSSSKKIDFIESNLENCGFLQQTKIMPIILESRKNEDVRVVKEADSRPAAQAHGFESHSS